ncbi:M18 family aminopeptidase [Desulfogranum mediterraneum]|uniref:M18 family aminopeptidase n=1 Tax=Desulfogranum mediterraneum TaxID=160661 RepID=UPI0003F55440|nr:M18 family aminopeptidase [Desulfogranum mediterraneum]
MENTIQPVPFIQGLFEYLQASPTAFHAVRSSAEILSLNGFQRLEESDDWGELAPGSYYLQRNNSSLIAFHLSVPPRASRGLRMAGAHTDSPCLKVKPQPVQLNHGAIQIGVEVYGGALLNPWFDRDLSLAGRVSWHREGGPLQCSLLDFQRPVAVIPSLAIHLDREANEKRSINKQTDLTPVAMLAPDGAAIDFSELLKEQLLQEHPGTEGAIILDHDLFFYDHQPPSRVGLNQELISGARLDNLLSCYALIRAAVDPPAQQDLLIVLNDHEETGSVSSSGAQGPFLRSVLERLYPEPEQRLRVLAQSLFISADNAHAVHPNFPQKYEANHLPQLNRGVVLKKNANQRYATDSLSGGLFKLLCSKAEVPVQEFVMRNDMACGSTIGPLTAAAIGVATVDVGIPSLAMHSIRETAGSLDGWYLYRALATFFQEKPECLTCREDQP